MHCTIQLDIKLEGADTTGWHSLAEDYRRQVELHMPLELELDTQLDIIPNAGMVLVFPEVHARGATEFCQCPQFVNATGRAIVKRVELGTGQGGSLYIVCEREVVAEARAFCNVVLKYVLCYGFNFCIGSEGYTIPKTDGTGN